MIPLAREFARRFYKSKGWERARKLAMERTITYPSGAVCPSGMCQRCFETTGRLVPAEIVHHKVYLTPENITDSRISLGQSNLMRVCRDCHAEIHYPDDYRPRMAFGPDGRAVPLD